MPKIKLTDKELASRYRMKANGKFAVGKPPRYTPEEVKEKIDQYFKDCDNQTKEVVTKDGAVITVKAPTPYTVTGIAIALDVHRDTLHGWSKGGEFADLIKKAKEKVENNLVIRGLENLNNPTVTIFSLKNWFKWKDKQEVHQKVEQVSEDKKKEKLSKLKKIIRSVSEDDN